MATEAAPMDEKAKRMRDLLSSFYAPDPSIATSGSSISASFDNINSTSFDPDQYMDLMVSLCFSSFLAKKMRESVVETFIACQLYQLSSISIKFHSNSDSLKLVRFGSFYSISGVSSKLRIGKLLFRSDYYLLERENSC